MGLFFGRKKDEKTVKITEFFSEEDLRKMKEVVKPKLYGKQYVTVYHQTIAKAVLAYVTQPGTEYNAKKLSSLMKHMDTFKSIEPSLEPILQSGLDKMQSYEFE